MEVPIEFDQVLVKSTNRNDRRDEPFIHVLFDYDCHVECAGTGYISGFTTLQSRLVTYSLLNFQSNHMTAMALASAGFILFTRDSDEVLCPWCELCIKGFRSKLNAHALHKAYSIGTSCWFVEKFYTDTSSSIMPLLRNHHEVVAR